MPNILKLDYVYKLLGLSRPDFYKYLKDIDLDLCDLENIIFPWLECKKSNIPNAGLGIFTKVDIPKGTFLGDYVCEIKKGKPPPNKDDPYCFGAVPGDINTYRTGLDVNKSNWSRYMNCSSSYKNENVIVSSFLKSKIKYKTKNGKIMNLCDKIFFWARRDIKAGEELMYYYSHGYAIKILNIKYKQHLAPKKFREYPRKAEHGCLKKIHSDHLIKYTDKVKRLIEDTKKKQLFENKKKKEKRKNRIRLTITEK